MHSCASPQKSFSKMRFLGDQIFLVWPWPVYQKWPTSDTCGEFVKEKWTMHILFYKTCKMELSSKFFLYFRSLQSLNLRRGTKTFLRPIMTTTTQRHCRVTSQRVTPVKSVTTLSIVAQEWIRKRVAPIVALRKRQFGDETLPAWQSVTPAGSTPSCMAWTGPSIWGTTSSGRGWEREPGNQKLRRRLKDTRQRRQHQAQSSLWKKSTMKIIMTRKKTKFLQIRIREIPRNDNPIK